MAPLKLKLYIWHAIFVLFTISVLSRPKTAYLAISEKSTNLDEKSLKIMPEIYDPKQK